MDYSLTDLEQWFNQHRSSVLRIYKEEQGDKDRTELRFDHLTLAKQADPDDYVSRRSLLLHGKGMMQTAGNSQPLPLDFYEIPITDQFQVESNRNSLAIYTDRGTYWIEPSR